MIGVFDSGSGGLTVLKPIRALLPRADILYFGDIKNAPYGNRPQEELSGLTVSAIRLLHDQGATSIVSACNSLSASLSISLFDTLAIAPDRLIEMVGPTAASFRGSDERLLLCATSATIRSQIYQGAFRMIGKDLQTLAFPELAGAIEAGKPEGELERIIRSGFEATDTGSFDTAILACTHYPLAASLFRRIFPGSVRIVDPGEAVAKRVARDWTGTEEGAGTLRFLISRESEPFRALVAGLFPDTSYSIEILPS